MTDLDFQPGHLSADTQSVSVGLEPTTPVSQKKVAGRRVLHADGPTSAAAMPYASPDDAPPQHPTPVSHRLRDPRWTSADGPHSAATEPVPDSGDLTSQRPTPAAATATVPPEILPLQPDQLLDGQRTNDGQPGTAVENQAPPAETEPSPGSIAPAPRLADIHLALLAEAVDDLERTRIANENRHRSLIQVYGLEGTPEEKAAADLVDGLKQLENNTTLQLEKAMRRHPLGAWVKAQKGIGNKQAARLLAAIGDPYWNSLHNRPRTVSELWAYSGLHVISVDHALTGAHRTNVGADDPELPASRTRPGDLPPSADGNQPADGHMLNDNRRLLAAGQDGNPDQKSTADREHAVGVAAKRRKGIRSNWSGTAKMRAYLIAQSCVKQLKPACRGDDDQVEHADDCACSPYRRIYDQRRAHTANTHPDWTAGHSHNDALRIASKAILKDLWIQARALHQEAP